MKQDIFQQLKAACKGLEYPSESDAPFDVIRWPANAQDSAPALVSAHAGAKRRILEVTVDQFFAQLADSDDSARFATLRRLLESQLTGLRIFRAGEAETRVDIYLIGKTAAGDWAGLHTTSVET